MIRLARHYIEEPPNEEPEHGWCPKCDRALVDAHECRCGWNEYEAIDEGATSQRAAEKETGQGQSNPPATAESTASPRFAFDAECEARR